MLSQYLEACSNYWLSIFYFYYRQVSTGNATNYNHRRASAVFPYICSRRKGWCDPFQCFQICISRYSRNSKMYYLLLFLSLSLPYLEADSPIYLFLWGKWPVINNLSQYAFQCMNLEIFWHIIGDCVVKNVHNHIDKSFTHAEHLLIIFFQSDFFSN